MASSDNVYAQMEAAGGTPGLAQSVPGGQAPPQNIYAQMEAQDNDTVTQNMRIAQAAPVNALRGVASMADIPGNIATFADTIASRIHDKLFGGKTKVEDMSPHIAEKTKALLDTAGVDTGEDTTAGKVVSQALQAAPSGLMAGPGGVVPAMIGGGASEVAKQQGASPVTQTLVGMAAGAAPTALSMGARGLVRGAETAPMQENIANAAQNKTSITAGQASGNPALQGFESFLSRLWGGGPLRKTASEQTGAQADRVSQLVNNLSQGADATVQAGGNAIEEGVRKTGLPSMKAAQDVAYNVRDSLIDPKYPTAPTNYKQALSDLTTPNPSMPNSTEAHPDILSYKEKLDKDLAIPSIAQGTLPYDGLSQLRSEIGGKINTADIIARDPDLNRRYKQLYDALSTDLDAAASQVSPQAKAASDFARKLYKANSEQREVLDTVIGKVGGGEAVYQAATGKVKGGDTIIKTVMDNINPNQQNMVRASILNRMGSAEGAGVQGSPGSFNPKMFLKNWGTMSPEAKDALFGTSGATAAMRIDLDSLAKNLKMTQTGLTTKGPGMMGHVGQLGVQGMLTAALIEGPGHIARLAGEHPMVTALAANTLAFNRIMAGALTSPRVIKWLAQSTKPGVKVTGASLGALSNMGPEGKELADALNQQGNNNGGT